MNLENDTPESLRRLFRVIYVPPGLGADDFQALRRLTANGGVLAEFVRDGGVVVQHVATTSGDQAGIAPGGVGFLRVRRHESATVEVPGHPYFTGLGYGGEPLTAADFTDWGPTDEGILDPLPAGATVLLRNADGPSLIEYPFGNGRVILSSIGYCVSNRPRSDAAATRNLLRYAPFYRGAAATPAASVTATPSPTITATPTVVPTGTRTRTPTPSRTPSLTPTPGVLAGDANLDGIVDSRDLDSLIRLIFEENPPLEGDVNGDARVDVTAADVTALLRQLGQR